jgi:integrator complex subunit 1
MNHTCIVSQLTVFNNLVLQGASQSMPWLAELVEANDSSLDVLPVQCLCEFLLHDASADSGDVEEEDERIGKRRNVYSKIEMNYQ